MGLIEQTRRLFAISAVLSLAATLPRPLIVMLPGLRPLAAAALAVLVVVWVRRYRTRRAGLLADLAEAAAVVLLVTALPMPVAIYICWFAAVWFRALYGSARRAVLYCALISAGALAAVPLWARFTGGDVRTQLLTMLVPVPALWLTMLVARALARSLFAREQSRRRDAALVQLGNRLIGLTDRTEIHQQGRTCVAAICAATPGLRALTLSGDGEQLRVLDHAGELAPVPRELPRAVLPGDPGIGGVHRFADGPATAGLIGPSAEWLGVALPGEPDGWIALGAPGAVPPDAIVAVQSMTNQVALALRTSEVHHELREQARIDPLTGLANRSAFLEELDRRRLGPGRCVLLFLDLDDFKNVNDELGHAAGDALLAHVASRLRAALRPQDVCARLGGDEFAVLLPDAADSAPAVAQRLVDTIAGRVSLDGRMVQVCTSVGLAFAAPGITSAALLKHADAAMYAAKARGKNRVEVFDVGLLDDAGGAGFERELAAAAVAGQLVVHYQPIVSVAGGHCVAVEALVRWQHPTRGLLPPGEFIPLAERTGAIVDIGAHVLRRACAEAAGWAGPSGPLALHVNVSAAQLTEPGFAEVVRGCVADFELAADQLVLEITESMVLDSPDIAPALDRLIGLGATIAIDDFGTGYSALTTLRTLPLDIVKIDRSFLTGGPSRAADEAVVEAIVEVAGRLGLRIVAEGVERVDQQQFLRRVGADAAQGYLYLRPTPAAGFARWLAGRNAGTGDGDGRPASPADGGALDPVDDTACGAISYTAGGVGAGVAGRVVARPAG